MNRKIDVAAHPKLTQRNADKQPGRHASWSVFFERQVPRAVNVCFVNVSKVGIQGTALLGLTIKSRFWITVYASPPGRSPNGKFQL